MTDIIDQQAVAAADDPTPISNNVAPIKLDELAPVSLGDRITYVEVDEISPDESQNIRKFPPTQKEIEGLAHDIAQTGQNTPMLLRKFKADGYKYRIVEGFQRRRALAFINENKLTAEPVQAIAIILDVDDAQALNTAISTMKRFPQSPIDMGHTILMLENDLGCTKKEIGKRLGKLPSQITEMSQFMELRPEIQRRIHKGTLPYGVARSLHGLTEAQQDEAIEKYDKTGDRDDAKAVRRKSKNKDTGKEHSVALSLKEIKRGVASLAGTMEYGEDEECPYSERVQKLGKLLEKFLTGKLKEETLAGKLDEMLK